MFVQMGFDNAVVVHTKSFTDGILRNLEPAVDIASEGRGEIKPYREGERGELELGKQGGSMGRVYQRQPDQLPDLCFIGPARCGEEAASVHGGILMVDAGGHGQRKGDACIRRRRVDGCQ